MRKRDCDANVAAWFASAPEHELYVSVLVIGEVRRGIARLERRDALQAEALTAWLADLQVAYAGRILVVDAAIAERWGQIDAARPTATEDALMAATAIVHDLTFVTRNVADVADTGARLLNPWTAC